LSRASEHWAQAEWAGPLHGIAPVVRLQRLQVGIDQRSFVSPCDLILIELIGLSWEKKYWQVWMSSVRVVSGKKRKRQIGLVNTL
jgi:hypothetical protein